MTAAAGLITYFAGSVEPVDQGWLSCNGAVLESSDYPDLFAVLGGTWGGNGTSTFALPTIAALGGCQAIIATTADADFPLIGQVQLMASRQTLNDYLPCSGQYLGISTYTPLYAVVRDAFGSSNAVVFWLPNLPSPGVGSYQICYQGYFPTNPGAPL